MAYSKVILNGTTLIDLTQDTIENDKVLSPYTGKKNDGTGVTGNIATKTSSNLEFNSSNGEVLVPNGYYATDASYNLTLGSINAALTSLGGATLTGTISRGNYIKISSGYYKNDSYYQAQANDSGTFPVTTSYNAATDISIDGYSKVNITGINVPSGKSFTLINASSGTATITNNGTASIANSGTITSLSSSGTITSLDNTGTITGLGNASGKTITTLTNKGTIATLNNTGAITIKSTTTTAGTVKVNAYPASGSTLDGEKTIVNGGKWQCVNSSNTVATVTASGTYYGKVEVGSGQYSPSVEDHTVTAPKVAGALAGKITTIGTTTKPSGTDGTDYWSVTPSTSLTATGTSSTKAKATITTPGYIVSGNLVSSPADTITITPDLSNGTTRYLPKAVLTATKTGGSITPTVALDKSSTVTWSTTDTSGVYITGTGNGSVSNLNIAANVTNAGWAPQGNGYATGTNLSISAASTPATETKYITGVTINVSKEFDITIPNGTTTPNLTLNFSVDSSGNVVVT